MPHQKQVSTEPNFFELAEKNAFILPVAFVDELTKVAKYLTDQIDEPKGKNFKAAPPNPKFKVKQGMNPYSVQNTAMDPRQKLLKSQKVGKPTDYKQPKLKPLNIKVGFQQSQYSGPMGPVRGPRQHSVIPPFIMPNVKTGGPPSEEKDKKKEAAKNDMTPEQKKEYKKLLRREKRVRGEKGRQRGWGAIVGMMPGSLAGGALQGWSTGIARDAARKGAFSGKARHLSLPVDLAIGSMGMGGALTGAITGSEAVRAYQKWKEKKATSPASMLAKAQKVGKPKTTAPPGPSIAQISKPQGFGKPLPGAKKGNNII